MEHKLTHNQIYLGIIAVSVVIPFLVLVNRFFPHFGIAVSLMVISSIIFVAKEKRSGWSVLFYLFSLVFSFFLFYRAQELLQQLNFFGSIFAIALLTLHDSKSFDWQFLRVLTSPLVLLNRGLTNRGKYRLQLHPIAMTKIVVKEDRINQGIISVVISLLLLMVIVPLLASANPLFRNLVTQLITIINLQALYDFIVSLKIGPLFVFRMILFGFLVFFIPGLLTWMGKEHQTGKDVDHRRLSLVVPKIVVASVIAIFFVTQIQLYTASPAMLQALGYTNSRYAREVFSQLTVVAMIIVGLIYYDKSHRTIAKKISYFLICEGMLLSLIAFKSVLDYSMLFGFTYKRLWGFTGVFWMLSVYAMLAYMFYEKLKFEFFVRATVLLSATTLLLVNVANFDYLIFHVNQPIAGEGVEWEYLQKLSPDADSFVAQLERYEAEIAGASEEEAQVIQIMHYELLQTVRHLHQKYQVFDIRLLNVSEYRQYLKIKPFFERGVVREQVGYWGW